MSRELTITTQSAVTTADDAARHRQNQQVIDDLLARTAERASRAESQRTRDSYASAWGIFQGWCSAHDLDSFPCSPSVLAAYLEHMAGDLGRKPATIQHARAAVVWQHRSQGHEFDARHEGLRRVVTTIRKEGASKRKAEPLMVDTLRELLALLGDSINDRRDAALLSLAFGHALRENELLGLDYGKESMEALSARAAKEASPAKGVLAVNERGLTMDLRSTKTAQTDGEVLELKRSESNAVAAVEGWVRAAGIQPGTPLFRGLRKGGNVEAGRLTPQSFGRIVKARMWQLFLSRGMGETDAKTEAAKYSTHSARRGAATSLAEAGVDALGIADVTRHKSIQMVSEYVKKGRASAQMAKVWGTAPVKGRFVSPDQLDLVEMVARGK